MYPNNFLHNFFTVLCVFRNCFAAHTVGPLFLIKNPNFFSRWINGSSHVISPRQIWYSQLPTAEKYSGGIFFCFHSPPTPSNDHRISSDSVFFLQATAKKNYSILMFIINPKPCFADVFFYFSPFRLQNQIFQKDHSRYVKKLTNLFQTRHTSPPLPTKCFLTCKCTPQWRARWFWSTTMIPHTWW